MEVCRERLEALIARWRKPVINTGDASHDNATESSRNSCADDLEEIVNELSDPDYGDRNDFGSTHT